LKEFLAENMPERRASGRGLGVFTREAVLVLAMLLQGSDVSHAVRGELLEGIGAGRQDGAGPVMVQAAFPGAGQPIRVILIGGEPWFATADVCHVLDREQPSRARKLVDPVDTKTVNLNVVARTSRKGTDVSTGREDCHRDNRRLDLVSESGLYTLVMKSRKPAAKPFRRWITTELLPSILRGDTDLGVQQPRMEETLAEAIGQQVHVVADVGQSVGRNITVMSDGTIHCLHGEMEICVPSQEDDNGPPFGPCYRCPEVEWTGIRRSLPVRPCRTIKFVEVVRRLSERDREHDPGAESEVPEPRAAESGTVSTGGMFLAVGTPE
jgi:prophage antirepressor-like protein